MIKKPYGMPLIQRMSIFVASLVAILGLGVGMAPNASAAWSDCGNLNVCFWVDVDAGGAMGYVASTGSWCRTFTPTFNNSITAVWNRMIYPVRFYTWDDCFASFGGFYYTVATNQQINFLSWPHADNFESMKVNP